MTVFDLIGGTLRGEVRRLVRSAVGEIARSLALAALLVAAAAFALFAAFQALLLVWPAWAAAAAVAAGLLVIGLVVVLAGYIRRSARSRAADSPGGIPAERLEALLDSLLGEASDLTGAARRAAEAQYRKDPAGTLMAAAAVGTIVGLLDAPRRRCRATRGATPTATCRPLGRRG